MNNKSSREERIRERAYFIWLEEGQPEGRDKQHIEQAERDIDFMDKRKKEEESGTPPAVGPVPGP
jgi:hypothetical protein